MIDKLKQIEDKLILDLLSKPEIWNSVLIDYHPPLVERMWTQIGKFRVSLHFIHACKPEEALFHPHPWPSAMHVLQGSYEMSLGFGSGDDEPEKICNILAPSGNMYYDMTNIDGWHSVRPVDSVCSTVMLTGEPWGRKAPKSDKPLVELDYARKEIMLGYFLNYYRNHYQTQRLLENKEIHKGDWIEFDQGLMSEYEKKHYLAVLNMRGYVIKTTETLIDARFGNDRIQVKSCFVKKMYFTEVTTPDDSSKSIDMDDDGDDDDDDFDPDFL